MSLESELNRSLSVLVSFMKENAVNNLAAANSEGSISLTEDQLRKASMVVESSIDQAFSNGYNQVLHVIKNNR